MPNLPDGSETLIAALARSFRDGSLKPMDDLLQERAAPCAEIAATKEPPSAAQAELERVFRSFTHQDVFALACSASVLSQALPGQNEIQKCAARQGLQANMTAQGPCNRYAL